MPEALGLPDPGSHTTQHWFPVSIQAHPEALGVTWETVFFKNFPRDSDVQPGLETWLQAP